MDLNLTALYKHNASRFHTSSMVQRVAVLWQLELNAKTQTYNTKVAMASLLT